MFALIIVAALTAGMPEVQKHEAETTAEYILTLKPKMKPARALRLAEQITTWAQHYDVEPALMVAIIAQESGFEPIRACWPAPWKGEGEVTCDHGLAQINETWIKKWALDPEKLVHDEAYNIQVQARVLGWYKRYFGQENAWFARYHSATPSKRRDYQGKIESLLALR